MSERNKVAFHNLGCKVNSYETDAMQQLLVEAGYEIVPFEPGADVYVINTCTVTNMADRKSRQMLHKARKMNPEAIVVAAGCYAQVASEEAKEDYGVDIILGNNRKGEIVDVLRAYTGKEKLVARVDVNEGTASYETLSISKTSGHTRAYIKIQDGCNQFCSYCLIPYARGRVRSRRPEEVMKEVHTLVENGYREIVLTGIHVTSYGMDFGEAGKDALLRLLQALNGVEGLQRIRLGSLEPRIMSEEFVREIAGLDKLCGHFHLSLQSGSAEVLRRMNRHYTPEEYERGCQLLNQYFDHPAITTDVIVGFPGETEEEFQESKRFVERMNFYETHVFKYSKRRGTRAERMDGQVPETVKNQRSGELLQLCQRQKKRFMEYYVGKKAVILIEEECRIDGVSYQVGHTKEYLKVAVRTEEHLENTLVSGRIEGFLNEDVMRLSME